MEISERIKEYRISLGLNQKDFAERLGISPSMIQKYEYGKSNPGSDILVKLNQVFGVNLQWLLTGKGWPDEPSQRSWPKESDALKRLKILRESLEFSAEDFASKLGLETEELLLIEKGEGKLTGPLVNLVCALFDVNVDWLLRGAGKMFLEPLKHDDSTLREHIAIPLLTNAGAATAGITEDAIDEKNFYAFRKGFIRHVAGGLDEECTKWLFLVRIKGDSMVPTLQEDEVALVNANPHTPFRQGAIYLIRDQLDMSTLAKRLYILEGKIALHSDNTKYPPVVIPIDEHNTPERLIIGRIRWSSRLFD